MKNKLSLIVALGLFIFSASLSAETYSVRLSLGTNQCVYVDGENECTNRATPSEEVIFKLIKNSNGDYFAHKELSTYLGTDKFTVTIAVIKESLDSDEMEVKVNLIAVTANGDKKIKVEELLVSDFSDLENIRLEGEPIVRMVLNYLTSTNHYIDFY